MSTVYFSGLLPNRFPECYRDVVTALEAQNVAYDLLLHTNDIWCRDYMPVQTSCGPFVQFRYDPSYLETAKQKATITDPQMVCRDIGVEARITPLRVDGGNVVLYKDTACMTERVFKENAERSRESVLFELRMLLGVFSLIIIPEEPGDPYGHADGCVRFIDEKTVLINKALSGQEKFLAKLKDVLEENGFSCVELPYFLDNDSQNQDSAVGNYINYLDAGNVIIAPEYKNHGSYNEKAATILRKAFSGRKKVVQVECTDLAKQGGVLNCVSWET